MNEELNESRAALVVEELARQGVAFFAVAPGSRSGPLALAAAACPRATSVVHPDERGLGFLAAGHARASGRPAAVIATSGTAAANLMPAVAEADRAALPLILLTADRPPELRACGANQAGDQVKMFGSLVRWYAELPAPDASTDPAFVLTTIAEAVARALGPPAGPVHLNCAFRDPLLRVPPRPFAARLEGAPAAWRRAGRPYTVCAPPPPSSEAPAELRRLVRRARRGLLVAGELRSPAETAAVARLARRLGWPVLADVRSGLRSASANAAPIATADLILVSKQFASRHTPDVVVRVGGPLVSRRLQAFLDGAAHPVVIRADPRRDDPGHRVVLRIPASPAAVGPWSLTPGRPEAPWTDDWRAADRAARRAVARELGRQKALSEAALPALLARALPPGAALYLGNSLPVRDADTYGFAWPRDLRVAASRGLSGIDGTLAAAAGYALASERLTVAVIGDLAAFHDLNSLLLLRSAPARLVIVVVNNDGGGIFSLLPAAGVGRDFARFFAAPHGLGFRAAAELFRLAWARPRTPEAFRRAVAAACARRRPTLIEVRTERETEAARRRGLLEAVARAVDSAGKGA